METLAEEKRTTQDQGFPVFGFLAGPLPGVAEDLRFRLALGAFGAVLLDLPLDNFFALTTFLGASGAVCLDFRVDSGFGLGFSEASASGFGSPSGSTFAVLLGRQILISCYGIHS